MRGRRLPISRGQDPMLMLEQPGDYCGPIVGFTGDKPAVFFLLPIEGDKWMVHVVSPPHVFTEMEDGSLEIRESILSKRGEEEIWHGYLDRGHQWRTV